MCKALWNVELLLVFFRQFDAIVFSVSLRVASQIHGYIIDRTFDYTNQLALWK